MKTMITIAAASFAMAVSTAAFLPISAQAATGCAQQAATKGTGTDATAKPQVASQGNPSTLTKPQEAAQGNPPTATKAQNASQGNPPGGTKPEFASAGVPCK